MSYTIELEKLTDEQLEAFKIIDMNAYKGEKEKRSTYSDEEVKNGQIFTDLDKAYYYLKPMYDNMRNNDTKKTITDSGILQTIEKVFRFCKLKNKPYNKFQPVEVTNFEELSDAIHNKTAEKITLVATPKVITADFNTETTGNAVTVGPEPVTEPIIPVPEPAVMPEPVPVPNPQATVVEDKVVIPATQSTLESMSTEELNKIMASIPAVEKI